MTPILCLGIVSLFIAAPLAAHGQAQQVATLGWLAGCWSAEGAEPGSGEQWLPPAGDTMFGVSRTVKGGKTVSHEFMQIRTDAQGKLVFIAKPSGQPEGSFVATSVGPGSVTFENPQHDFPQRVRYAAIGGDRIAARIEGTRNGVPRGIDFPLNRVQCDALAGK